MDELLVEKLLRFSRLLRKYGINVSYSEIVDALQAISEVGLDKERFYNALACTLIKDQRNMKIFFALFQFFFNPPKPSEKAESDKGEDLDAFRAEEISQDETKMVESAQGVGVLMREELGSCLKGPLYLLLVKAVKAGDYRLLQFLAHRAVEGLGSVNPRRDDIKDLLRRAKKNIGWDKAITILFGPQYTF
ncbi:MAG: hypothetical protein J7M13_00270 [Synergistetes bacterium]|nr:hypothetical protein [Synergistota bacterium]